MASYQLLETNVLAGVKVSVKRGADSGRKSHACPFIDEDMHGWKMKPCKRLTVEFMHGQYLPSVLQ